jgi:hypothetical protein
MHILKNKVANRTTKSSPGTPSDHSNRITALCTSLMDTESGVAMLTLHRRKYNWLVKFENISQSRREFVLLSARKTTSAANTASFKINNCGHFLTYLRNWLCSHLHHQTKSMEQSLYWEDIVIQLVKHSSPYVEAVAPLQTRTGSYPERAGSSPLSYTQRFQVVFSPEVLSLKFCSHATHLAHLPIFDLLSFFLSLVTKILQACYIPRPSTPLRFSLILPRSCHWSFVGLLHVWTIYSSSICSPTHNIFWRGNLHIMKPPFT